MTILGQDYAKVTTCADLDQVRTWTNNGEVVNVFVMNDIDCGNKNFAPIGQSEIKAFEGIFDGNGKTISGMNFTAVTSIDTLNLSETVAGFFGIIGKKGVVKNITISKSKTNVTSSNYAGILVGLNYGVIEGAKTTKSDTVKSSGDVGGIAGRNGGYGTMIGCENRATVKDGANAGGIAGANTGAISTSINYAAVSGTIAGGIVGNSHYRTIQKEKITHVPGRIAACQNLGSVSGSKYAGGIVGENKDGSINNCRNDGSVAATNTYWTAIAGGVVGYSYFDNNSKYESGNYTAVVLNSFSTTNSVTGKTVGGVVGKVGNESSHKDYSKVENCYYDSQVLSKVTKAVGSEDNSTITTVKGETTANMNTNEDFVRVLNTQNGKIEYTFVWLFESGNYPVLNFSGCHGNYKITFVVNGKVTLEATTVKGKIVEATVADPTVPGAVFRGWKDDHGNVLTSAEAQTKFYTRAVTYNAVLNELFEITFVTDYGAELAKKSFEKNTMVFYYDEENGSEVPADLETDSATYKFTGWDRPFAAATKDTTYTAQFEKIAKTFTVTFYVQGETYDEQTVAFHANAQAPADPVVKGFRFDGWDKEFTDVTTDLEIDALLTAMTEVCFVTVDTTKCDSVPVDTTIVIPDNPPSSDSLTCDAWLNGEVELHAGDELTIAQLTTLEAKCSVNKLDVKFFVLDNMIDSQSVAYGTAAQAPADPVVEGYRFENWDKDFSYVITALNVNANMTKMTTVCVIALGETKCEDVPADSTMPTPVVPSNEDSTCTEWTVNGETFTDSTFIASEVPELVAKCHANELIVSFYVAEGSNDAALFKTQKVAYEAAATDPKDEVLEFYGEGYRFDGWDKDFSKVVENLDVTGKVTKMTTVCVIALGETKCEDVPADSTMPTPVVPSNEDSTCTEWTVNGETFTDSTFLASEVPELLAKCHANAFDVKFVAFDTVLVDSQRVAYDSNAVAPEVPAFEGYRFDGWDKEFTNVQSDLIVNAKMTAVVEYCIIALGETKCDTVPADTSITTPVVPSNEDSTCTEWTANGETFTAESFTASEVPELVAKCHANAFDVKFVAFDTVLVDSQRVAFDSSAVAPADPVFEGYRFDGWDKEFTNVQSDLTVNAKMTAVVEVCFVALGETKCDTVPADTTIETPDLPSTEDSTCVDWTVDGETFSDSTFLASEVSELVAVCLAKEFDVKFVAFDTVLVDSQRVAYGTAAIAPDSLVPVFEGYRFSDWDADFTYVEDNMTVNAVFDTLVKVSISIEVSGKTLDSSFYVLKDTVITGLKSMIDSLSGTYFVCSELTVNGAELTDTIVATSDIEVGAVCQPVVHTVRFFVEEKLVHTKSVLHGTACEYTAPAVDGKKFVKWDKNLNVVLEDLDVNGIYVDLDTIKVVVSGEVIDSVVVAKGDSVEYVLPKVQDTDDSAFVGWKVNGELLNAGDTIIVKYGDKEIVASFELGTSLRAVRSVAKFSVFSENGQLQVIGARIGDELTVLDLQGRVIAKKFVQNSVELISVATRGSYLVRVGTMTKRVVVR
ncbi:InlB B-repeat-containing protein [uncultured Fibrobacter sp.]|uniref:InlB B-repeat-containing protein n=1 Tax=uncultured Fibrobacter sp. TaxID=261512 RepID=UPI0025D5D585|nr:InlB B-repeat-containing protein [uncultured Fibrobacter sp.]